MGVPFRMTLATQNVLLAFLSEPQVELFGREIAGHAKLASGTIYPILARLEGAGWLSSRWEEIDPTTEGRRPRRYYRLTPTGVEAARSALSESWSLAARLISGLESPA